MERASGWRSALSGAFLQSISPSANWTFRQRHTSQCWFHSSRVGPWLRPVPSTGECQQGHGATGARICPLRSVYNCNLSKSHNCNLELFKSDQSTWIIFIGLLYFYQHMHILHIYNLYKEIRLSFYWSHYFYEERLEGDWSKVYIWLFYGIFCNCFFSDVSEDSWQYFVFVHVDSYFIFGEWLCIALTDLS